MNTGLKKQLGHAGCRAKERAHRVRERCTNAWLRFRRRHLCKERILVLGDSHIEVFENSFEHLLPFITFETCMVRGATVSGLRNPHSKTQSQAKFTEQLDAWQGGGKIIVQIGEVDLGFVIWYKAQRDNEPVDQLMKQALQSYRELLSNVAKHGHPIVISVPLPTIGDGKPHGEVANLRSNITATQRERTDLTLRFNQLLAEFCKANNMTFIDLDQASLAPETQLIRKELLNRNSVDHHYDFPAYARLIAEQLKPLLLTFRISFAQ